MRLRLSMDLLPNIPDTYKKYECPYCNHILYDKNEKYFDRLHNFNLTFLILRCPKCRNRYGFLYNYKNEIITFVNPVKEHQYYPFNEIYDYYFKDLDNYNFIFDLDIYIPDLLRPKI